jgi:hypothetical protein
LIHSGVPVALVRPLSVKKLEAVVLMVTLLPAVGVKTEFPFAWKVLLAVRVAATVAEFATERLLFRVVKPFAAPMVTAVAAPPILSAETPELRRLKVPAEEVRLPPFTARLPAAVIEPFEVTLPLLAIVNWVVPAEEAVKIGPRPVWLRATSALPEEFLLTVKPAEARTELVPIPRPRLV